MFKRLLDSKLLRADPTRTIKQLSENEPPFHVLTDAEEKAYLLACPPPIRNVAALMLETVTLSTAIYNLKRQSVYLDKNFLKVEKGKTRSARRRAYLTKKSREILGYRMQKFDGQYLFPQNVKDGSKTTKNLDAANFYLFSVLSLNVL